jgi:hypothetical protein
MSDFFNKFYNEAANATSPDRPFLAIWVHHDGRNLGMTGVSQHRLSSIPSGYVNDTCPLDDMVDIYVTPDKVSRY